MFRICNSLPVVCMTIIAVTVAQTPCSLDNRRVDMSECILKLKGQLFNNTAYWFGEDYRDTCPDGAVTGDILCANPRDGRVDSIAHRLFPDVIGQGWLDGIDRYLEVAYSHGAGSYSGCGFDVTEPSWEGDIDPLAQDRITAWNTRLIPDIRFNASDSEYFTFIVYDVGNMLPHAVYVNVEGNNVAEGIEIKAYHGPQNPFPRQNPYVFLLYKQSRRITVTPQWIETSNTNNNGGFNIANFANEHSLTGPVGLNWMSVVGDLYTAGLAARQEWMYTCPLFVSQALQRFGGHDPVTMTVDVTFQAPRLDFELCCKDFTQQAQTTRINPFTSDPELPGQLRMEAERTISFQKLGLYADSEDFQGDVYSLFLVDVGCSMCIGDEGPMIFNFIANIRDGDINTGDMILNYTFPDVWHRAVRVDPNPSRFYYKVYRQEVDLPTDVSEYRGNPRYVKRCFDGTAFKGCNFKVDRVADDFNMTLVGANTYTVQPDEYSDYFHLTRFTFETHSFCQADRTKFPNYAEPCGYRPTTPSSADHVTRLGVYWAWLLVLSGILLNLQ